MGRYETGEQATEDFKAKGLGRPQVSREIRDLIRKKAVANSSWGAPRIYEDLLRQSLEVSE